MEARINRGMDAMFWLGEQAIEVGLGALVYGFAAVMIVPAYVLGLRP